MGARAVVVGLGLAMVGVLAIQTSDIIRGVIGSSRRSMDGATAKVTSYASGVAGWTLGFGRDAKSEARITELEGQIRDLQRYKDLSETMALRMDRYEKLLHLIGETQGQSVVARVVAEENGPFADSRIANAGGANGVREGFAATNENGLVGRVVRVGEYTARILVVTDFSSRIPVMGTVSGDRALMVGDGDKGARLVEPETPDKIVPGEVWVTSGDDGQLPLGIRVGKAHKVGDEWKVDLAMREGPVDFVRLAPPPDFAKPEAAPPLNEGAPSPNTDKSLMSSATPPVVSPATAQALQAEPAPAGYKPPTGKPAAPKPAAAAAPKPAAAKPDAKPPATPATPGQPAGQGGTG